MVPKGWQNVPKDPMLAKAKSTILKIPFKTPVPVKKRIIHYEK